MLKYKQNPIFEDWNFYYPCFMHFIPLVFCLKIDY
nr:MAG TPA: hypothetical protein [Caudoviricetes sp.]